jgi:AcrR family transcriptional regulator
MNQSVDITDCHSERRAIMRAAWEVVERSGFEGFKVQLVLKGAGVSARTFYRHFADKDALLIALMQDETARAAPRVAAAVAKAGDRDPAGQVRAWVAAILSGASDPARVRRTRLFSGQQALLRQFPAEAAADAELLLEPLRRAIERGAAAGQFPWAEPDRDAQLIYDLTGNVLTRAVSRSDLESVNALTDEVARFALRALGKAPGELGG